MKTDIPYLLFLKNTALTGLFITLGFLLKTKTYMWIKC